MAFLPTSGRALTLAAFDHSLQDTQATCDLRSLTFIDAYGLVGTACAIRAGGGKAAPVLPPASPPARSHLAAMGFDAFLTAPTGASTTSSALAATALDVVVPLSYASDSGGAQALSNLLWEQLRPHVDPLVLNAIAEGVWEMVANAIEHSGDDALVMGQVYKTPRGKPPDHDDRVQVVIGDAGRGIRQSFLDSGAYDPSSTSKRSNTPSSIWRPPSSMTQDGGRGCLRQWSRPRGERADDRP